MALRTGTPPFNKDTERYAEFGRAAVIPGIQAAIYALQELLDTVRMEIAASQGRATGLPTVKHPSVKRTAKIKKATTGAGMTAKNYWSTLTPEERSAEMRRRFKVREQNAAKARRAA